jgi:Ca-activated chloride channel family protein
MLLVEARAASDVARPPLCLNVLLDRSASMGGAPLATALQAVRQLAERLGPGDRLGLLTFDARVEQRLPIVPMDGEGRERLAGALADIEAGHGTALHDALLQGVATVRRVFLRNAHAAVCVLTDGEPSVGPEAPRAFRLLAEQVVWSGVEVHALGLGAHYVAQILEALTLPGGRGYHHVDGPADLSFAMGQVLGQLVGCAARGVSLQVNPGNLDALEVLHRVPVRREGELLNVGLGSLATGGERLTLLRGTRGRAPVEVGLRGLWTDGSGEIRSAAIPVRAVELDAPEGRLVRAVKAELSLLDNEAAAWRALEERHSRQAELALLRAEEQLQQLVMLEAPRVSARVHLERLGDLRYAFEHGAADVALLARRAAAARSNTGHSSILSMPRVLEESR